MSVQCLNVAYLGGAVPCCICRFFLDLPVVKYLLMPFLSDLFSLIFTQRMCEFNSLLLALAVNLLDQQNIIAVTVHQ